MNSGLDAVLAALDAVVSPVDFFLRDDDAGWNDERLFALLRCTERARVPVDLALIPTATGARLAAELRARFDGARGQRGLHQHGHAHNNFETSGRKCEFGPGRAADAQRRDLIKGREHLRSLFGARLDGSFTPPWNRCSMRTPALLAELGYSALSRDRSAPPQQELPELPVDVDWCRQRRLALERSEDNGDAIAFELARQIRGGATVGLMLHHAQMSDIELDWLQTWLSCWSRHSNARWRLMHQLLVERMPPIPENADARQPIRQRHLNTELARAATGASTGGAGTIHTCPIASGSAKE